MALLPSFWLSLAVLALGMQGLDIYIYGLDIYIYMYICIYIYYSTIYIYIYGLAKKPPDKLYCDVPTSECPCCPDCIKRQSAERGASKNRGDEKFPKWTPIHDDPYYQDS